MIEFFRAYRPAFVLGPLFVLCWLGIGRQLWTPDEPREAEISREMLLRPSLIPTLNGERFVEKPPLYYWLVAATFELTGGPSVLAARSISAIASCLTLLAVFLWGRRDFSESVGLAAAFGLATSTQFLISSHWVLMDPLLMLVMTLAAWLAWNLITGRGGARATLGFYLLLAVALWIKGLIGPILLASGFVTYAALSRTIAPIYRLRPVLGAVTLIAATAVLAALIGLEGGSGAVREWLWVNHVQRFFDPQGTGHDQPFYYYLLAVPIAVLPWWVPLAECLRPSSWTASDGRAALRVYLGALVIGIVAVLSASATKRSTYLLPVLPLLFLLLADVSIRRWLTAAALPAKARVTTSVQFGMLMLFAAVPSVVVAGYLRRFDGLVIGFLAICVALAVLGSLYIAVGRRLGALVAIGAGAVVAAFGLLVVTVHLAAPEKNMGQFAGWLDSQLPRGATVFAIGNIDETLYGIVPFVTGRSVVPLTLAEVAARKPPYVLVQDKEGGSNAAVPGPAYELAREQRFGPGRYVAVWRRTDAEKMPEATSAGGER